MLVRVLCIGFVVFFFTTFAITDSQGFNGYEWEKTGSDLKGVIVALYLEGYRAGALIGVAKGIAAAREVTKGVGESDKKHRDFTSCSKIIESNQKSFFQLALQRTNLAKTTRDTEYYVNEIDSFFKTYPLCRRKDIKSDLLMGFATIWFNTSEPKQTYREMGERCSQEY